MKKLYAIFALIMFLCLSVSAQIPNGGFESWTGDNPNSWTTNNVEGVLTTITKSNSAHTGSSALKGEVVNLAGFGIIGPYLISNDGTSDEGFVINKKYNSVKGYYKLNTTANDQLVVIVGVYTGDTGVGAGVVQLHAAGSYTQFSVPIAYEPTFNGTPDHCVISIQIFDANGGSQYTEGTEMYMDDLEISMDFVSSIDENISQNTNQLMQNRPNPFSTSTSINFNVAESNLVTLKVYDILGNEVKTILNKEMSAGNYDVSFEAPPTSNGIFFYKLTIGNFTETRMMQITK